MDQIRTPGGNPAETYPAEIRRLRQILWDIYGEAGADQDGVSEAAPPGVYTPDIPELAIEAVRELHKDYSDALEGIESAQRATKKA